MKPDVYNNVPRNVAKYGLSAAVEVAKFEASQVHAIKELVEKEQIDCDFVLTRSCDAILDEKLAKETDEAFTKLSAEMNDAGIGDSLRDIQRVPSGQAERVSQPKTYISYYTPGVDDILLHVGIRCQGRKGVLHIYCRPHLAIQDGDASSQKGHPARSQPSNHDTRHQGIGNASGRWPMAHHHRQRQHQG